MLEQDLARASVTGPELAAVLTAGQPLTLALAPASQVAATRLVEVEAAYRAALIDAFRVAATRQTFLLGHGGVTALSTAPTPVPEPVAKGLFCRIFAGDPPCGPRPPLANVPTQAVTLSEDGLDSAVGTRIGQGASQLFRQDDDARSPTPAGYTFLGQLIDHDLTDTLIALGDSEVASIAAASPQFKAGASAPIRTITLRGMAVPVDDVAAALERVAGPGPVQGVSGTSTQLDMENIYRVTGYADLVVQAARRPWFELDANQVPTGLFNLRRVTVPGRQLEGFDYFRRQDPATPHQQVASIGDGRNDENRIISGVQSLLMLMHNQCMTDLRAATPGRPVAALFDECHTNMRMIFQTIVLTDFLPRILDATTLREIAGVPSTTVTGMTVPSTSQVHTRLYQCRKAAPGGAPLAAMPMEFGVAGFRLGHSLLRTNYRIHRGIRKPLFVPGDATVRPDLLGSRTLRAGDVIDWGNFFAVSGTAPQHANLLDTHITRAVGHMPVEALPKGPKVTNGQVEIGADGEPVRVTDTPNELNLPRRNVRRSGEGGGAAAIVTGEEAQAFAHAVDSRVQPVSAALLRRVVPSSAGASGTPLWLYILAEAEERERSAALGPLGSRIVGEVILGVVDCDTTSVINALASNSSTWAPMASVRTTRRYSVPQLIHYLHDHGRLKLFE